MSNSRLNRRTHSRKFIPFVLTLMCGLAFTGLMATQAQACGTIGNGPYWQGRVYVVEIQMKLSETCKITFSRRINVSTDNIEITNISAPGEMNVKFGPDKDGQATLTLVATKEGTFDVDYYIQSMVTGRGVQAHWQREHVSVVK